MLEEPIDGIVRTEIWTEYAREIYRRACAELVYLDLGARGTPNKVRSSRMAWLRKRLDNMEPEQVAHAVRPQLQSRKPDLDGITAAWLPLVSEHVGPNDEYHDTYWSGLSPEEEKLALSNGFELLKRQLNKQCDAKSADHLLHASFSALSGFNCKLQLIYRLMLPKQRSAFLLSAKQGRTLPGTDDITGHASSKRQRLQ